MAVLHLAMCHWQAANCSWQHLSRKKKRRKTPYHFLPVFLFFKDLWSSTVQQISMLIRDFMDEVRPLQNFTIMKSAGSEVVLVDASDQWCGGSHQASICVVPVTQHLRTRWLHSSKFVQSCFLVYDEWVSGSFRPWTYSQLLRLSCWQTLNCEVELLVSNFKTNLWKISRSLAFSAAQILMCKSDRPHEWVAETCHRTLISWGWPFLLKERPECLSIVK